MVRSTIAHEVVKIWEGSDENEVISIMLPHMSPKMIITGSYGIQANTYGVYGGKQPAGDPWQAVRMD